MFWYLSFGLSILTIEASSNTAGVNFECSRKFKKFFVDFMPLVFFLFFILFFIRKLSNNSISDSVHDLFPIVKK